VSSKQPQHNNPPPNQPLKDVGCNNQSQGVVEYKVSPKNKNTDLDFFPTNPSLKQKHPLDQQLQRIQSSLQKRKGENNQINQTLKMLILNIGNMKKTIHPILQKARDWENLQAENKSLKHRCLQLETNFAALSTRFEIYTRIGSITPHDSLATRRKFLFSPLSPKPPPSLQKTHTVKIN
jgi:hypothetical protein